MRVFSFVRFLLPLVLILATACEDDASGTRPDVLGDIVAPDPGTPDADAPGDAGDDAPEPDGQSIDLPQPPAFDPVLAASLQALLDEHVAFSPDPGLTLTVRTADGAWWSGAAGIADLADGTPMMTDTAFRVGSNTKPFVAATILLLVEEGKIDLEAPLTAYLPEYAEWSDIPVRLLLNMRSGLPEYLGILPLIFQLVSDPEAPIGPRDILEYVRQAPRDFAPGTSGKYTNSSYLVLGLIIEAVTGNPADQEIRDRIIAPLGLANTYLDLGDRENDALAEGYIDFGLAGPALGLSSATETLLPDPHYVQGLLVGTRLIHPAVNWTAGSMVSTSRDMAVLVQALLDGDLLTPASRTAMMQTVPAQLFNGLVEYGLGLQVRPTAHGDAYGHGGLNFGYQAGSYFFPDTGVTISHLHNFLLDAYDGFQDEMLTLIRDGGDPDFLPCLRPDDLFKAFDTGAYLNVAFKGRVNGALDQPPIAGNAFLRLATADGPVPFTGIFPSAAIETSASGTNVVLTGYGLANDGDADLVITTLVMGEGLFSGLDADGRKAIGMANLADFFLLVAKAWTREGGTDVVERFCYVALSDYRREGEVKLCGGGDGMPARGDMLRVFGTAPYLDDPTLVAATLGQIGLPSCLCLGEDGEYAACVDAAQAGRAR